MEKERKEIDDFFEKKLQEVQQQKLEKSKSKKKKNKKGIFISTIALILAGAAALGTFMFFRKKNNNNSEDIVPPEKIVMNVDDLGMEETTKAEENNNQIYGEITGDINKDELVVKDDTIWKDEQAANKSEDVGKTEVDLQDGEYEIDQDGDVVVKEEKDYVIVDEDGETKETGSNKDGIPEGCSWDPVLNKYVKTEDVGKFIISDATYYGPDGEIAYEKGQIVRKDLFEKGKQYLTTTKPEKKNEETTGSETSNEQKEETTSSETKEEVTSSDITSEPNEEIVAVVNPDGTFTIDGITFIDKATYESIILGECNEEDIRYNENGVIYIEISEKTKTR